MIGIGLGLVRQAVRNASGQLWTPAQLFSSGEQGVWYEPKPEYLYQDAAGTVPVTADGDPVGLMLDLSGNDNHGTQATSAARPIYRTDGTLHWLEFDGVDDFIQSSAFARNQPSTAAVAIESYSQLDANKYFDGLSNNSASLASFDNGNLRWYSGSSFIHTSKISLNQKVIASCFFNSTNSSIYGFNGVYENGDVGTANANGMHIGSRPDAKSEFASMYFYGAVVESDAANSDNLSPVDQYLANLAGVTL